MLNNPRLFVSFPVFGLGSTIALSVIVLFLFLASQLVGVLLFAPVVFGGQHMSVADTMLQGSQNGTLISLSIVFTCVVVCGFIALLIWQKQAKIVDYLALKPFKARFFYQGLLVLLALNFVIHLLTVYLGREPMAFMDQLALSAKPLGLLMFGMVIVAPIYEEVMFRGFMWLGLACSRLGVIGASALTGAMFALIHFQYAWVELLAIFVLALLFGYMRFVAKSLLLPIVLHMINNALAMALYLL
ncbi:abortive infection protein [Moraxella macacae 0408225]|uniref:Abortive infection protein n=1 Tax=Moraxella macacae 0408225 TaxID=1230338 RepID=L2F6U5_9GAMM|nr:type II CAAX endopeptidase family protein [Moraxella macacae]ELA08762.1 abortive infection protein [Moraxella macacae 0408225]